MPRVLRIINRFNLGGPTYNAAYLTRYLEPEFETLLAGGVHDPTEASSRYILDKLGVSYELIPEMKRAVNVSGDLAAYRKIMDLIRRFKPDIVHTHASKAGALGRLAAMRSNVPVIVHTFHGHVLESYFSPIKNATFIQIERFLARRSNRIIALSRMQKDDLSRILRITDHKKISVVPLGFDLARFREDQEQKRIIFREKFSLDENEVAIGIVGRLVPVKNHGLFLDAISFIAKNSQQKIRAFIIGDGEEREHLEKMAAERGILFSSADVQGPKTLLTFTSWIKEMDWVMAGLDIVSLTSLNEGTPVSLIEAQAAGKPVVSTRVGGIEDVVIPGKTALLSDVGDTRTFCDNLLLMVQQEKMRLEFSQHGWDHVKNNFHYTRLVGDIRKLYMELLEEKSVY